MGVGDRVLDALGEGLRARAGTLLQALVTALTAQAEPVDVIVSGEDGWAVAFDLDDTPYPGALGQIAGVSPAAVSPDAQRAAVRGRGSTRGTPGALIAAARGTLTSTGDMDPVVELIERDGSAYRLRVRTYAVQTPDSGATLQALLAAKPASLVLTYEVLAGQDFHEVAEYGGTFAALRDSRLTFEQLLRRLPDNRDERSFTAATGVGTFYDASGNTFARFLRPHLGRDRPTTVRTFGRLATRSYAGLRTSTYQQLPTERT